MIATLTIWIRNIIFVVLFASFLELLLPSNHMKKFVSVIMGLFIMLAILNPILDLLNKDWQNEPLIAVTTSNHTILDQAYHVAEERDALAITVFKKDLARQVKATLMALDGIRDVAVTVDVADKKQTLANLHLTIFVQPGIANRIDTVSKVVIDNIKDQGAKAELDLALQQKIRRTIQELYGLQENQIEIKLWH